MSYQRYKTSKVLIDDNLLEGIVSMELPYIHIPIYDQNRAFDDRWLVINCINKKYPNLESLFETELEIKVIHDKIGRLYIARLILIEMKYEDKIYRTELNFKVLDEHKGTKCIYCNLYGMDLETSEKDGLHYKICKLCGKAWYEWDELNDKLEGKRIFKDQE